jgi:hypothetical protein
MWGLNFSRRSFGRAKLPVLGIFEIIHSTALDLAGLFYCLSSYRPGVLSSNLPSVIHQRSPSMLNHFSAGLLMSAGIAKRAARCPVPFCPMLQRISGIPSEVRVVGT